MRDARNPRRFLWRNPRVWREWLGFVVFQLLATVVIFYAPIARLFGFEAFEARHGGPALDFQIFVACSILCQAIYLYVFRRKRTAAELAAAQRAVRQGRMKRMSFAARWLFIVAMLVLVTIGCIAGGPHRLRILSVTVPLFLLFCAAELNFVLHPGELLVDNPRDELLAFFRARMLQVGYIVCIAALVLLFMVYLFAPGYVGLLLPLLLVVCLLVPNLVYNRLDRRACVDV